MPRRGCWIPTLTLCLPFFVFILLTQHGHLNQVYAETSPNICRGRSSNFHSERLSHLFMVFIPCDVIHWCPVKMELFFHLLQTPVPSFIQQPLGKCRPVFQSVPINTQRAYRCICARNPWRSLNCVLSCCLTFVLPPLHLSYCCFSFDMLPVVQFFFM